MATAKKKQEKTEQIALPRINIQRVRIKINGVTSLICNRWSERAIAAIEVNQSGVTKTAKKEPRNPEQEFRDSLYVLPNGKYGFPSGAFKKAGVEACRQLEDMTMTEAKTLFHVLHEYVEIEGTPQMRRDMRRLKSGTYDPVYRGEFLKWSCVLEVMYNADRLSLEMLLTLFQIAGLNGVGGFRPSGPDGKSGNHGMFEIGNN